jgi:DNA-binding IscR family transcriptional regulator
VGDLIRRLEGRLTVKEALDVPVSELSSGKVAVHLLNERLNQALDRVLDQMTLEQLVEDVSRAASSHQAMYYI